VSYLKTGEGWLYHAVVMDLYSRIVGWHISKRMTLSLVENAFLIAYSLRKTPRGLVFYSDRGSQYTSKGNRRLLTKLDCRASMGDVGACWDNAL
jgi:putative transposase